VIINKKGNSNKKYYKDTSYAAHITYDDEISASLAVIVFISLFRVYLNSNIMNVLWEVVMDTLNIVIIFIMEEIVIRTIVFIYTKFNNNEK
jgi:hypothetical protein